MSYLPNKTPPNPPSVILPSIILRRLGWAVVANPESAQISFGSRLRCIEAIMVRIWWCGVVPTERETLGTFWRNPIVKRPAESMRVDCLSKYFAQVYLVVNHFGGFIHKWSHHNIVIALNWGSYYNTGVAESTRYRFLLWRHNKHSRLCLQECFVKSECYWTLQCPKTEPNFNI